MGDATIWAVAFIFVMIIWQFVYFTAIRPHYHELDQPDIATTIQIVGMVIIVVVQIVGALIIMGRQYNA